MCTPTTYIIYKVQGKIFNSHELNSNLGDALTKSGQYIVDNIDDFIKPAI